MQVKMRLWGVLLVFIVGLGGCKSLAGFGDSPQPPARNGRIAQLEDELRARDKQIEELRDRQDLLGEQAKKLEFLNEQLQEQLKAVGDAPRQRDRYKQQAAENQLEIERLRRQIKELKRATGEPASRPAGQPTYQR